MVLPSARLRDLARDLARPAPSRTNPHRYFEQKSELVADLRDLARAIDGHRPVELHVKQDDHHQLRLAVVTVPPGLGRLPPISTNCLYCRRRRAHQGRRVRLRLPGLTLFEWAERTGR